MIEEKEELQGQLIASGQIVGSIVGCKGEKGEKGDPGEPGSPGSPGTPGQDGFSPIASISKTGKIATITITDSQGTTTAEIRDGEDGSGSGDMLKATYDTNNNGIVDNAEKVNNHTVQSDVPANAVFTDTTYTAGTGIEITAANVINNTQTSAEWGNISGDIDDQTDLQNVLADKVNSSDLSTVATSGSYNDLSNKPTIPTKVSDLTNDSGFINKNVNDLTNYTTTSVINTLLAGKENDIPVQGTAPASPEADDLWIDTSDDNKLKYFNGINWVSVSDNITGDTLPIGSQIPYGSTTPPANWLVCDGSAVSRTTYAELFAVIGTSYGAGDGSTTFNLPNKKGRKSVGYDSNDTDFNAIGKKGGEKTHTLTVAEMPSHGHNYMVEETSGSTFGVSRTYGSWDKANASWANTQTAGGGQAHNIEDPFEVDCWIIKATQSAGLVANVSNTQSDSTTDTYSCDYINKTTDYSTTEQVIGKWIDDKPLYRKTYYISALGNATSVFQSLNINNLEEIVSIKGVVSNNQNFFILPSYRGNDDTIGIQITVDINNGITITTGNDRTGYHAFVTIEYTKTTD